MNNKFLSNFYSGGIFHVYNRTNNKELLFKTDENRLYFLQQYSKYLQPFLDTFCWCLLPNHFHFLVRVKDEPAIKNYLTDLPAARLKPIEKNYLAGTAFMETLIELEWKRFFTSYAMAFNKQHNRSGNLFHRPCKRLEVIKETHFTQAIIYVHANALKHQLCSNFTEYKWSSWHSMLSLMPTELCRNEVLDWFGGIQPFINTHTIMTEYYYNTDTAIEDE